MTVLLCLLAGSETVHSADRPTRLDFDHILYVRIHSDPPGAAIYSGTTHIKDDAALLGYAPYTVLIGLSWERKRGWRRWESVRAWSECGGVRAALLPDGRCAVYLSSSAVWPDRPPAGGEHLAALLHKPTFPWSQGRQNWPEETRLLIKSPDHATPDMEKPKETPLPIRLFVMADAGNQAVEPAELKIVSTPMQGEVLIDDTTVGSTPARIVLPAGRRRVRVHYDDLPPFETVVDLEVGQNLKLHVSPPSHAPRFRLDPPGQYD